MWRIESVVPGVSFYIMVRKNICALKYGNINKRLVLKLGLKKLGLIIEKIFIKSGAVQKILLSPRVVQQSGNPANTEIVISVLKSLATRRSAIFICGDISLLKIFCWIIPRVMHCFFICVS